MLTSINLYVNLYSEQEILREEITSLQAIKTRLHSRITELEEEMKKTKEDLEKAKTGRTEEDDQVFTIYLFRLDIAKMSRTVLGAPVSIGVYIGKNLNGHM